MNARRSFLLGLGASAISPTLLRAKEQAAPDKLEPLTQKLLEAERRTSGVPALAAAAAIKGQAAQKWFTGERARDSAITVGADDRWHLGSITKSMTATLVARLVELNAVRWDDTVEDLLGSVVPGIQPGYRAVTFRHLLSHRAGLPADISRWRLGEFSARGGDVRAERRRYAALALSMPPAGPMKTTFLYSNNGYVVAGAMLEAKLGGVWEELVRKHVFEPLELTSAGFGVPGRENGLVQPVGHASLFGFLIPAHVSSPMADNPVALGPAGRVHMSLNDVLTYLAAHRDRHPLLTPESWRTLHTPPFGGDYAMGWLQLRNGSHWHNGTNNRWYAEVVVDTAGGFIAVAATNEARSSAQTAVNRTLKRAVRAVQAQRHPDTRT
jgi:CubicO group peptidase (beta-lactamase class C family)